MIRENVSHAEAGGPSTKEHSKHIPDPELDPEGVFIPTSASMPVMLSTPMRHKPQGKGNPNG